MSELLCSTSEFELVDYNGHNDSPAILLYISSVNDSEEKLRAFASDHSGSVRVLITPKVLPYHISLHFDSCFHEVLLNEELTVHALKRISALYSLKLAADNRLNSGRIRRAFEKIGSQHTVITDLSGNINYWGEKATSVFGYSASEVINKPLASFASSDEFSFNWKNLKRILNANREIHDEFRFERNDGKIIWLRADVFMICANSKEDVGIAFVFKDVTEEKQEQMQLRIFESVVKNTKEKILIVKVTETAQGTSLPVMFANAAFLETTGYSMHEVVDKEPFAVIRPAEEDDSFRTLKKGMDEFRTVQVELRCLKNDGTEFWNNILLIPVTGADGVYSHFVFVQRDITELRKYVDVLRSNNEELTKVNLELDKFVYGASHDLRAPLNSILGLAALMQKEPYGNEAAIFLDKIILSAKRLNDFISNIIRYSKNNRIIPQHERFSPLDIFNVAKDLLSYSDRGRHVRFLYFNPGNILLNSDKERWQVVVNNLFSNSVKFSRNVDDAYVKLSVISDNTNTCVSIEDNGMGIEKEQIGSIFEMFYKGEGAQSGSGLGLFIVRQTLEAMGCSIRVESSINYKTTFTITLPNTTKA